MTQLITDRFGGIFCNGSGEMWCSSPGTAGCIQKSQKLLRCLNERENNCPSHPFSSSSFTPQSNHPNYSALSSCIFLFMSKELTLYQRRKVSLLLSSSELMGDKYAVKWPKNKATVWLLYLVSSLNQLVTHQVIIQRNQKLNQVGIALMILRHYLSLCLMVTSRLYISHITLFSLRNTSWNADEWRVRYLRFLRNHTSRGWVKVYVKQDWLWVETG